MVPSIKTVHSPPPNCQLCPRLVRLRDVNRITWPNWHNAPVASFGPITAELLIVGLAPGLKGANRTGRPFTGDFAGDLLFRTLSTFGFSKGQYNQSAEDGLSMKNCRITNGVRCLPPQNKPTGLEIKNCRSFLENEIKIMKKLKIILTLGGVAHTTLITALGKRRSQYKFSHGALHELPEGLVIANSYHCSRYNTNTGRLSEEMFANVFREIQARID